MTGAPTAERARWRAAFQRVRGLSLGLMEGLSEADWRVQSMADVSPPWWNLGHTSWFFARNLLHPAGRYRPEWQAFEYPLNSYYEGLGPRLERHRRGSVGRPGTEEVREYRAAVDAAVLAWIDDADPAAFAGLRHVLEIGLHHEQQHQELLLSEILHIRFSDPPELRRPYRLADPVPSAAAEAPAVPHRFVPVAGGVVEIGHRGDGFCWDNELPAHRAFLADFALGNRPVTCGEWLQFMADGGYREPLLWLANGWARVQAERWQAPLYWQRRDGGFWHWTLLGWRPVRPAAPVCHVSFYEAEAYARWRSHQDGDARGARLPTEREWEHAARSAGLRPERGNLLDDAAVPDRLVPQPAAAGAAGLQQLAGDVWEWTSSHYEAYPGYRPFDGALMEYNGKFMDNQRVLRGGSLATPRDHLRVSYRNFWPGETRFQFTGLRLCQDDG